MNFLEVAQKLGGWRLEIEEGVVAVWVWANYSYKKLQVQNIPP
jgi:hypothetical protein